MIIAFSGAAGCGKDTAADYLAAAHGFRRFAFADPIREMLGALGLGPEDFARERKELPLDWLPASPRGLAQTLGTEWGRDLIDPTIWIRIMARQVDALPPGTDVVISDARFNNEAIWVTRRGGLIVHIHRNAHLRPAVRKHQSEDGITMRTEDVLITNDGDIHELYRALDALVETTNGWTQCTTVNNRCLGGCRSREEHERYMTRGTPAL